MRWPWQKPRKEPVKPPKVGGTRAPNRVLTIGFERPHDYHIKLSMQYGEPGQVVVFKGCTLVGFTTPIEDAAEGARYGEEWYDRWLVLRRPDGRLVYVPRGGIVFIEESMASAPPPDGG